MDKVYQHNQVETKWQQVWAEKQLGKACGSGSPYTIVIPPPNVTGTLHMGHGFQLTIMDILIRYHRMNGHKTLWQVGTDHAGIATQMVVERQLAAKGTDKHALGREQFLEQVWAWKEKSRTRISQQMQALGTSMDWERERFTLDSEYAKKVIEVFVKLHREGLIYRGQKLVNWDPKLKTAVSDLEVINEERSGHIWYIKYEIKEHPGQFIEIATTRPETLLGDQAVAVHPEDQRYQKFIGCSVKLPLTNRIIPIIADEYVEPEFGSGCVKITPAHDFNDAEVGKRHQLEPINIMHKDATLNSNVPKKYQGLERFAARKQILEDLGDLLIKTEPHKHIVPIGDRSNVILEPLLTNQWFFNCEELAKKALAVVQDGTIEFIPEHWFNTYKHWLENIQDWCISRQLWWGHQIPAWHDAKGNVYVGQDLTEIKAHYQLTNTDELTQDPDVLDTWFSSALWPFVTLGWEQNPAEFLEYYPSAVLVTGFDIIFFWVARMIMLGLYCTEKIPFKQVYITGLIKDEKGQKMSKSKGNVLDPLDLINGITLEELITKRTSSMMQPKLAEAIAKQTKKAFPNGIMAHGTDALRFTFAALASNGRDIRFDVNRLTGYRNFCNKIWNASRLVLSFPDNKLDEQHFSDVDRWLLHSLQLCTNQCHTHIKNYRFDLLAKCIYEFTWHEFCDHYLEWVKIDQNRPNSQASNLARYGIGQILKLIHPIMPFITEEIWANLMPDSKCLALSEFPMEKPPEAYAEETITTLFAILASVRNFRSELYIPYKNKLDLYLITARAEQSLFDKYQDQIKQLLNCEIYFTKCSETAASIVANNLEFAIPIQDLVEPKTEITRIEQVIKKANKLIDQANSRLQNQKYLENAPAEQVKEYQQQLANAKLAIKTYTQHHALMQTLLDRSQCE